MDGFVRSQECRELLSALGVHAVLSSEELHAWRLSGVERLYLANGDTAVFKYALRPFLDEHRVLAHLREHGVPVPELRATTTRNGMLGMLLKDLGPPIREPTEQDAAAAAVRLHAALAPTWLDTLDEAALAALPGQTLARLEDLQAAGRFPHAGDLLDALTALDRIATSRAVGADRPPFGFCHGELHPSAVHVTAHGYHVLDFAMALRGPGLLDLAAWSGLRKPANPSGTRRLMQAYVHAGGDPAALTDRGGLPPERWALGWHRIQAAHWLLGCATNGIDPPDTDARHTTVLRRQLTSAAELLAT
ncbi:MAG: phosphotransferase [Pseudonocardia sp.]|nr:phosphotransferase [Pseudonocardia sp.]